MTARFQTDSSPKAVISVSEMARLVGLSRNHFWALCKRGIFPMPSYSIANRRPFYDMETQQACIRVRSTNIGHDGQYVIFYAARQETEAPVKERPKVSGRMVDLSKALKQNLGLEVTPQQVETAAKSLFPQGLPDDGQAIRALFLHFKRSPSA